MSPNALIRAMTDEYVDFRRDESRSVGNAESIAFPQSTEEIAGLIASLKPDMPVTIQGARTGIAAGAVPQGGLVLSLTGLKKIIGLRHDSASSWFFVTVQPGVLLETLNTQIYTCDFDASAWSQPSIDALALMHKSPRQYFPPDPTEATASIGGMVACNASGAHTFFYGATRPYVEALRIVLSTGELVSLRRGQVRTLDGRLTLATEAGRKLTLTIPPYKMPSVKNAAGLYAAADMDAIDLFIGSEGILGIIAEIELRLIPAPALRWGLTAFLPDEAGALQYVRLLRGEKCEGVPACEPVKPAAIEFFNTQALNLLRSVKAAGGAFAWLPEMPPHFNTAVYIECHGENEDEVCEKISQASELLQACGGSEETTSLADNQKEMENLRKFRHALPEVINMRIDELRKKDPALTKLGTDMAVPDAMLEQVVALYNADLKSAQLESVIFGHIGNNHLHVNILPASQDQYRIGKQLYEQWAQKIIAWGGTISAEHGVGRLKKNLLLRMYGQEGIAQMKAVKLAFDPALRLNPGVMFD
jgi:D-lactate dehydrogenase (cytochrome)